MSVCTAYPIPSRVAENFLLQIAKTRLQSVSFIKSTGRLPVTNLPAAARWYLIMVRDVAPPH
jgi:hypothetical protein